MSVLDALSPKEVGDRLRIAREEANLTQKDAADHMHVARTTLVAIEKGERRIRFGELQELAKAFGKTINSILRIESIHIDLAPRFRKLEDTEGESIKSAVKLLSELARAEVELENLLGVKRGKNYPPERPILRGDVRIQAEQDAQELRQRLGLGHGPILDVISLLELELDIRVYIRKIDPKISGMFVFDPVIGPCILLNANHPKERRNQSAAHECGHYISTRNEPEVSLLDEVEVTREERYANAFGRAFLAPTGAVLQKFRDVTAGSTRLTRRHVIVLAHHFGISREAMVRRLEELGLVKMGMWDWFVSNGGISEEHVQQTLGDLRTLDTQRTTEGRPTTLRLNLLAGEVYRKGLLSEGQLAQLLHIDRTDLRESFSGLEVDGSEAEDAPVFPE